VCCSGYMQVCALPTGVIVMIHAYVFEVFSLLRLCILSLCVNKPVTLIFPNIRFLLRFFFRYKNDSYMSSRVVHTPFDTCQLTPIAPYARRNGMVAWMFREQI